MRISVVFFLAIVFVLPASAQNDSLSNTALLINASYSFNQPDKQFSETTLSNQRVGYLQLAFIANMSERNVLGLHAAWQESTLDSRSTELGKTALHLERTRQYDMGILYRRQRKFLQQKMLVFVQVTGDLSFATERGRSDETIYTKQGSGLRFQVRPGVTYALTKATALEMGFGKIDAQYMQWDILPGSGASGTISHFDFNTSFNFSTVYLGFKLAF